jgi:hypothetical protein
MDQARRDLFDSAGSGSDEIEKIAGRWDGWARSRGLADALLYTAPASGKLKPLLDDLGTALSILGGGSAVTLD